MERIFDGLNGVAWTITYLAAIFIGYKRQTWCIPGFAICIAFSWELLVVISRLINRETSDQGFYVQTTWLLLDAVILVRWVYFSCDVYDFVKKTVLLGIIICAVYLLVQRTGFWETAAFLINLLMSIAFILRKMRDTSPWTSILIAVTKLMGTLSATLCNGWLMENRTVLWLGGLCLLADVYYLILLLGERKGRAYEII